MLQNTKANSLNVKTYIFQYSGFWLYCQVTSMWHMDIMVVWKWIGKTLTWNGYHKNIPPIVMKWNVVHSWSNSSVVSKTEVLSSVCIQHPCSRLFITQSFLLHTAPLQPSGSPTPITTSSTVLLQAPRWDSLPPQHPVPPSPSLQVEVCHITALPGQMNGCVFLLTLESSRQQAQAPPLFHYDRVPIMIVLLGFYKDTSGGMDSFILANVITFLICIPAENNRNTDRLTCGGAVLMCGGVNQHISHESTHMCTGSMLLYIHS